MALKKGRGAQKQLNNTFNKQGYSFSEDWLDEFTLDENPPTTFIEVFPKSIVNTTQVPGAEEMVSMNPYQGCEHGCIYCYARVTHNYWGYNAGNDFEQKVLIKKNAAELLDKKLKSKSWKGIPILVSGNTDCYQPVERKLEITRAILKVFLKYKHPVAIITKNALIIRDLDILQELAKNRLVEVNISLTTLNEELRRVLEPRTSSAVNRLKAIKKLSEQKVPVNAMLAPVIPSLNSMEIPELIKQAAENGAWGVNYQLIRLKDELGELFRDWVEKTYPDRAGKVMKQIAHVHDGKLWQSYGHKSGSEIKNSIKQLFQIHQKKYFPKANVFELNRELYDPKNGEDQLRLF